MKLRALAAALLVAATAAAPAHAASESSPRFVPPPGRVLLMIGQDMQSIRGYLRVKNVIPGGFSTYTTVRGEGLTEMGNNGGGIQNAWELLEKFPDSALQVAYYMGKNASRVAAGEFDDELDEIADFIRAANCPVYFRIGYQFDLPEKGYSADVYIGAYRHVVDRLRARKVTNVAFVWHSYGSKVARPHADFYPGDDYVDWFAISYFNQPKEIAENVAKQAREHGKPLMIAEAAPWGMDLKRKPAELAWEKWFVPLLDFMQRNDVRVLTYINCNWDHLPLFNDQHWGDSRIEMNKPLLQKWKTEFEKEKYLRSSPNLFETLGFTPDPRLRP